MPVLTETTDAAAATSTTYSMAVGDYFFGTLGTTLDSDWVRVDLTAGQTYTFGLVGVGALTDNLDDSYLRLRNNAGTQIAFDDDGGPGLNSALTFTATTTGTYYLDVQSFNNSTAGNYGLSVTLGFKASYDVEMGAGVLLRPDASWAATPGTGATVTWGIRATGPGPGGQVYDAEGVLTPYILPSAAQIAAIQNVLAMFDGISGLDLVQVNPGGTTNSATMLFGAYSSGSDGAGAFAFYPGSTASSANAGDLWLNNNSVSQTSLPQGSFSYFAILHEVGHGVGLAHPGDYNAAPGVSITYANNAQFIEDTHQYTVMSYFDESNTTSSFFSYPDTLLLYDIYALHQLYGADFTFHAGNTTYGFNATVGGAYDFTTNTNPVLSIWDGGGIDTLDLSGYGMAQVIDLRAGRFSDVGGLSGNLSIAIGAVIENVVGGSGNDRIIGNAAMNVLNGDLGNDTLNGGDGMDTLYGGLNDDLMYGGNESDQLFGSGGYDKLFGEGGADRLLGEAGNDTLNGGLGNDTLNGGDGMDTLYGGLNDDLMYGGNESDQLFGSGGYDKLFGEGGADRLLGEAGNDTLNGGLGNDTLNGGDGMDTLYGGLNDDLMYGGNESDQLFGSGGYDKLFGEGGADRLLGEAGNDTLNGGLGNDTLNGGDGMDTLYGGLNDDLMYGGNESDQLFGSGGYDKLFGEGGADRLLGEAGNDTLNGGLGNDTLNGGLGNDRFIFNGAFGDDEITDFEATNNLEKINLTGVASIIDFADLIASHMNQVGMDVVIDDGLGNTITLIGVNLGDLDAPDFIF